MSVQTAEFGQGFPVATQPQAGFKVFPGLAPEFISQADPSQGQQQLGVIGAILQPLLCEDQLFLRLGAFQATVQVDQLVAPVIAQHLAQQGFCLGFISQ